MIRTGTVRTPYPTYSYQCEFVLSHLWWHFDVGSTWLMAFVRRRNECDSRRGEPWGRQEVPLTRHQVLLASRKTQLLTFLSWNLFISTFSVVDLTMRHRHGSGLDLRPGSRLDLKPGACSKNYFYLLLHLCANRAKIQCFYFSHILSCLRWNLKMFWFKRHGSVSETSSISLKSSKNCGSGRSPGSANLPIKMGALN